MNFKHIFQFTFLVMFGLFLNSGLFAQTTATAELLFPQIGQSGSTVEVTLLGEFLHEPKEVLFYQPGIRCTKLTPVTEVREFRNGKTQKMQLGTAIQMTFEIDKKAKPGEYQLRVRTNDNLSEMVTFWVTPFPVIDEVAAWTDDLNSQDKLQRNDSAEFSQLIPLNSTVSGYLPNSATQDHDWFSVECKSGERLSAEVIASRLGTWHYGRMNDPSISIFDSEGKELARNDDNALHTQDPYVSINVPKDGKYYIHMRQQMDYESPMRHYALHVGNFARPKVAFPLGGQTGKAVAIELLDDTGNHNVEVSLPSVVGNFEAAILDVNPKVSGPYPRPNRIHAANFGDVFERKDESPQEIKESLPIAINGKIETEGEVDWYRFSAKKGERYRVFAYAKTLDSELDPRVWIRPAPGNPSKKSYDKDDSLWEPHDRVGHHYRQQIKIRLDSVFMFEPDTDGDWLIGIGDTRRESGPDHIYRIEFQPHVDSTFVHFPKYPAHNPLYRDRIVLFPGQSYSRPISVQNGFGSKYNGQLQLRAKNLPVGVTMIAPSFTKNDATIQVMFEATKEAKFGAYLIDLVVEPVDKDHRDKFRGGFIANNPATDRRGGYAMYFDFTRKMSLAVVDGSNFDIQIDRPSIPLVKNGEIELTVRVERKNGFQGAVYCEMDWLPNGVQKQPPLIIPAEKTSGTYKLRASNDVKLGAYGLSITARENELGIVRSGAGFHYVSSPLVNLNIGEPYVTIELGRTSIERGKVGEMVAEITHRKPFSGEATLRLGRLPFGVEQVQPFPTITSKDKSAKIKLHVTKDCLINQYKEIYCEVVVNDKGQQINQQSGSGTLRVDPERK